MTERFSPRARVESSGAAIFAELERYTLNRYGPERLRPLFKLIEELIGAAEYDLRAELAAAEPIAASGLTQEWAFIYSANRRDSPHLEAMNIADSAIRHLRGTDDD